MDPSFSHSPPSPVVLNAAYPVPISLTPSPTPSVRPPFHCSYHFPSALYTTLPLPCVYCPWEVCPLVALLSSGGRHSYLKSSLQRAAAIHSKPPTHPQPLFSCGNSLSLTEQQYWVIDGESDTWWLFANSSLQYIYPSPWSLPAEHH